MSQNRPTIIAGNWKMYKTMEEAQQFFSELLNLVSGSEHQIRLAVPFTMIHTLAEKAKGTLILIGAQNMSDASEGAFTGEIAGRMLREVGAQFVLLGHSERRHIFGETNAFIQKKVVRALEDGIQPLLCFGETLDQREQNQMEDVLKAQILEGLEGVSGDQLKSMVLAYEPVWAIGTGRTASPEQAQEAHHFCREVIRSQWGDDVADTVPILYGGSVKPENSKALMDQPDLDGVLVGGASLSPETFAKIVNFNHLVKT